MGARATTMLWPRKNGARALASLEVSSVVWREANYRGERSRERLLFFLSLPLNPKPSWGSPSVVRCVKDKARIVIHNVVHFIFRV
jgi:hypothetical protein